MNTPNPTGAHSPTPSTYENLTAEGWHSVAKEMSDGLEYYRGLLDKMAPYLGEKAFICDDGSVSDSPLRAKFPELVLAEVSDNASLKAELTEARAEVKRLTDLDVINGTHKANLNEVITDLRAQLAAMEGDVFCCPPCDENDYEGFKWCDSHDELEKQLAALEADKARLTEAVKAACYLLPSNGRAFAICDAAINSTKEAKP
jgi:hypothetical protein